MAIGNFPKITNCRKGGIKFLCIADVDDIEKLAYGEDGGQCTQVVMKSGGGFVLFEIKEDSAEYSENITRDEAGVVVEHRLAFMLERMDSVSAKAVGQLAADETRGVVVIIEFNNGERMIVGYSSEFEGRFPLRLKEANANSGRGFSDENGEKVVLQSVDTQKAAGFIGEIPQ